MAGEVLKAAHGAITATRVIIGLIDGELVLKDDEGHVVLGIVVVDEELHLGVELHIAAIHELGLQGHFGLAVGIHRVVVGLNLLSAGINHLGTVDDGAWITTNQTSHPAVIGAHYVGIAIVYANADIGVGIGLTHVGHAHQAAYAPATPAAGSLLDHHSADVHILVHGSGGGADIVGRIFIGRAIGPLQVGLDGHVTIVGDDVRRHLDADISLVAIVERAGIFVGVGQCAVEAEFDDGLLGSHQGIVPDTHVHLDGIAQWSDAVGRRSREDAEVVLRQVVASDASLDG